MQSKNQHKIYNPNRYIFPIVEPKRLKPSNPLMFRFKDIGAMNIFTLILVLSKVFGFISIPWLVAIAPTLFLLVLIVMLSCCTIADFIMGRKVYND